jgi:hypothetical protein
MVALAAAALAVVAGGVAAWLARPAAAPAAILYPVRGEKPREAYEKR